MTLKDKILSAEVSRLFETLCPELPPSDPGNRRKAKSIFLHPLYRQLPEIPQCRATPQARAKYLLLVVIATYFNWETMTYDL
jgi:hypothetical protein